MKLRNWLVTFKVIVKQFQMSSKTQGFTTYKETLLALLRKASKSKSFRVISALSQLALELLEVYEPEELFQRLLLNLLSHKFTRIRCDFANNLYLRTIEKEKPFPSLKSSDASILSDILVSGTWEIKLAAKDEVQKVAALFGLKKLKSLDQGADVQEISSHFGEKENDDGYGTLINQLRLA